MTTTQKIEVLRKTYQMTWNDIALIVGVSRNTVLRYNANRKSVDTASRMLIEVAVDQMFNDHVASNPPPATANDKQAKS